MSDFENEAKGAQAGTWHLTSNLRPMVPIACVAGISRIMSFHLHRNCKGTGTELSTKRVVHMSPQHTETQCTNIGGSLFLAQAQIGTGSLVVAASVRTHIHQASMRHATAKVFLKALIHNKATTLHRHTCGNKLRHGAQSLVLVQYRVQRHFPQIV